MKLRDVVDEIRKDISAIKVEQGKQGISIDHHIKRSDVTEASFVVLKSYVDRAIGAILLIGLMATVANLVSMFLSK